MKSPKINQAEDKILDEYLKGKSHLSDSYKQIALDLPGVEVDSSILAASRREVNARPKSLGADRWRKWQMPFSIAAVLVISASLTLTMTDFQKKSDEILIESAPIVVTEEAKLTRGDSFGSGKAGNVEPNKTAAAPIRKLEPVERAKQKMAPLEAPAPKMPEPKPTQVLKVQPATNNKAEASPQAFPPTAMKKPDAEYQTSTKVLQPEQDRASIIQSRQTAAMPSAASTPTVSTDGALASANVADKVTMSIASAPAPAIPPAPAAAPVIAAASAPVVASAADTAMLSKQAKPARAATSMPAVVSAENATGSAAQAPRKNEPLTEGATAAAYGAAQTWLAKIEALLREEKTEEAEQTLAEFKKRFPNYVIPESIKEELAKQRAALNAEQNK
jgi:hypothetical protein